MQHQLYKTNQGDLELDILVLLTCPVAACLPAAGGRCPASRRALLFKQVQLNFSEVSATGLVHKGVSSIHREKIAEPPVETL